MRVSDISIYPVKGVRGVSLDAARVEARGLADDRRWIVTDETGAFLSQRNCEKLAQINADSAGDTLTLSCEDLSVSIQAPAAVERAPVTVWNDIVNAVAAGSEADEWLTRALGRAARLWFMDDKAARTTSGKWGEKNPVSFADGYPLLIANAASLKALNAEIEKNGGAPVGMDRFRPNIVIDGADPWAEDCWKALQIGDVVVELQKPCVRCEVTTRDQKTGERMGKEPLATLARIRRAAHPKINGVLFGVNAVINQSGTMRSGDLVSILDSRAAPWPVAK
ncbi:MAG: MOSC N-terminal beta barrel domain-containing protein [Pseudomonadota bacterium]